MVEPSLVILSAVAIFLAALVQGLTGFGFVMLAAPILTAFIAPQIVVPTMLVHGSVLNVVIMVHARHHLSIRRVAMLALPGAIATPLGTYLLVVLDESVLKIAIGVVVGGTALAMLAGYNRAFRRARLASVPVGATSGLLNASTGLAGPPVVLFFANQGVDPREFRATIVGHFIVLNIVAIPAYILAGIFTRDQMLFASTLLPAALAGAGAGIGLARFVSQRLFMRIALALVLFAGIGSVAVGILG